MNDSIDREKELLEEALNLPESERSGFLRRACGNNQAVRERLGLLLRAHALAGGFIPVREQTNQETALPIMEKVGDRIGRYKVLQKIGEGGCGTVYMAEQEEPVRRRVALKIIKPGMDSKQVVARFEAERQALALMDHPNIAKVLDGGTTQTGRPYFVMELVRGVRITDYCDEAGLSTKERLSLFVQVCHAIQHAHQKGIIHRDLKPSNILVTLNDGVAVPKVIDFGIAKAIVGQPLTEKTMFTAFEQFIGTPAYMSPEQALMTSLDIDTRSDIYALGVLLYELLTGRTPFDAKAMLAAGIDEMRRTIRESEPARPSARLSTLAEFDLTTAAKRRATDPPKLIHSLKGELDWIVMKCLEKDRSLRYETANGLALDLKRYLSNEPVNARPPTTAYRLQKAIRRNKAAFAAAGGIVLVLLAGLAATTWQAVRATRAERLQLRLLNEAELARRNETKLRQEAEGRESIIRANIALAQGQLDAAEKYLDGLSPKQFERSLRNQAVFHVFGEYYVLRSKYADAADAIASGLELFEHEDWESDLSIEYVRLGACLVETGRLSEYAALCDRMITRFGKTKYYLMAYRIVQLSLIVPRTAAELNRLEPLVNAVSGTEVEGESALWKLHLLGLYEYRRGNFSKAVILLNKTFETGLVVPRCAAADLALLAQAHGALNEVLKARAAAANARQFYEEWLKNRVGPNSQDWLIAGIFLREMRENNRVVRANWLAQEGKWSEALPEYRKAVQEFPDEHLLYHELAPLLAHAGFLEEYRLHCQKEVTRFRDTKDPNVAERMAKDCLILPESGVDPNVIQNWAETALTNGNESEDLPWFEFVKALAEFRAGRFRPALEWTRKVLDEAGKSPVRDLEATLVKAMAEYRLGETAHARSTLQKALEIQGKLSDADWIDRLIADRLLNEARALLGPNK